MDKGAVVYVPFPFTKGLKFKRRPAVILRKAGNKIICAAITSKIESRGWKVQLKKWQEAGLKKPSAVLVDTVFTMTANNCNCTYVGKLEPADFVRVEKAFEKLNKLCS